MKILKMANKKGNNVGGSKQKTNDSVDYSSFKTVLFYCSLIVFLPVVTFFLLKGVVLDQLFTMTEIRTNIFAAVGAVVSLHLALGLYVYRAYFGGDADKQTKRD
ncbi:vacuolar ATPase assembly integral membrane protein VMA21 homolog [Teleopsis dalmanni]|uniref:vacuolar ATPase assembly integral membrane protein VMA21 homolog n=1 Tax=Teleopsis dalmanni TaxID=139649 RepID=UPI0018CF92AC|nr:vacuolar ATPase assembly integral membrane protein VMA21 homolog [Teleopsis dalmanni]